MVANERKLLRCSIPLPGVEVLTSRDRAGRLVSTIHGGPLDGEDLPAGARSDVDRHHQWACTLAAAEAGQYN